MGVQRGMKKAILAVMVPGQWYDCGDIHKLIKSEFRGLKVGQVSNSLMYTETADPRVTRKPQLNGHRRWMYSISDKSVVSLGPVGESLFSMKKPPTPSSLRVEVETEISKNINDLSAAALRAADKSKQAREGLVEVKNLVNKLLRELDDLN